MVRAEVILENISEFVSFLSNLIFGLKDWFSKRAERRSLRYELDRYSDREVANIKDIVLETYVCRRPDSDTINVEPQNRKKRMMTLRLLCKAQAS